MRCASRNYYIAHRMSSRKPFLEFNKSCLFVVALHYSSYLYLLLGGRRCEREKEEVEWCNKRDDRNQLEEEGKEVVVGCERILHLILIIHNKVILFI